MFLEQLEQLEQLEDSGEVVEGCCHPDFPSSFPCSGVPPKSPLLYEAPGGSGCHFSTKPPPRLLLLKSPGAALPPPLSLELPLLHGFLRQLSLLGESLADVHALVLEDLEGELYGSVLGLGNPAVG
mgnify:CR=1 FL=1